MKVIDWKLIYQRLNAIQERYPKNTKYYGVPRGGVIVAGLTGNATNNIEDADVIIDDLIDSGKTKARYDKHNKPFEVLIYKREEYKDVWIVFPWEQRENRTETVEDNILRLCQFYNLKEVTTIKDLIDQYEKR